MRNNYLAPELPIRLDENNNFIMIEGVLQNVRQKLKMLFLTNPGEKIMEPEFGIGIRKLLFENPKNSQYGKSDSLETITFEESINRIATQQVSKYLPDVTIKKINTDIDDIVGQIVIEFEYKNLVSDSLILEIT